MNKTCICVLGMHRSGTSCLTGIMQNFGVELGEVFTENPANKRGNRENGRIVFLNEALLGWNDASWNNPVIVRKWTPEMKHERDAIIAELTSRPGAFWGFKDTRTLFTLPFWLEAIDKPKFIGTFRHPQRVALSLLRRDKTAVEQSWELWLTYNQRLLQLAREKHIPLVDFDLAPEAYLSDTLEKLVTLGLDANRADNGSEFFDSGLRNQESAPIDDVTLPAPVADLYAELREYHQNFQA
jgi:hypothetical protein